MVRQSNSLPLQLTRFALTDRLAVLDACKTEMSPLGNSHDLCHWLSVTVTGGQACWGETAVSHKQAVYTAGNTSQQDFVPRKVCCVSNVTFHAESKYAINIFPSPTVFVQWHFLLLIFRNFSYFLQ
jgi:hypothetical protein